MKLSIDDLIKDILGEHRVAKSIIVFSLFGLLLGKQFFQGWEYTGLLSLSLAVIIFGCILYIVFVSYYGVIKGYYYRWVKYPKKNLDKSFFAFLLNGTGYIFEIKNKKYRWISSWQTAQDCNFIELWTEYKDGFDYCRQNNIQVQTISGRKVKIKGYKENGGKIHTRGIPGS